MCGPISSVGGDLAPMFQALMGISQGGAQGAGAGGAIETSAGGATSASVQTLSQTVQTGVQGLLQSSGSANQNDKVMQALMALLLLVLMLANGEKDKDSTANALSGLSQELSKGSARSSTLSSQSSFYFESTTVTFSTQSPTLGAVSTGTPTDPAASSPRGSQIDVAA